MTLLTRREVFMYAGAILVGCSTSPGQHTGVVSATQEAAGNPDLRIVSASLPETISPDEPFQVRMTVENTGDEPAEPTPSYAFDGQRVLSGGPPDKLPVAADDREEFTFGGITLHMIDQSLPGEGIAAGEYEHSIGFIGGPRESASVTVAEGSVGDGGGSGLSDSSVGGEANRERGFFTNSGDEPEILSNVFNLTVLGFLLSVAGIIHQMLQGR